MSNRYYYDHERQRQRRSQNFNNAARDAGTDYVYSTSGTGQVTRPSPIRFANPFLGPPAVQYGYSISTLPDSDYWQMPQCSGGVADWVTERGGALYVGFYPYAAVSVAPQPLIPAPVEGSETPVLTAAMITAYREALAENPPTVRVNHQYTFSGRAYKRIPGDVVAMFTSF